jgi:DNA helicase IV
VLAGVVARSVPHNIGRGALRTQLARLVRHELVARRGEEAVAREAIEGDLRANRGWSRSLDRLWPPLGAPAVVRRLLSSRAALTAAASGVLAPDELAAILRAPTRRLADEPWTAADLALLDEAEAAISGPPRSYGHIVVDEAQDLSAMGLRALARRSPASSMTVLGDLAQGTSAGSQVSWDEAIAHLGTPPTAQRADLDLGYRVPASIMDVANELLAEAAPDVTPCRSVRAGGRPPTLVAVAPGDDEALATEVRRTAGALAAGYTTVGVVVPHPLRPAVGAPAGTVLAPTEAKGLEFDAVVVVEPALIAGSTRQGLRLLYVALTRAVQELVVVHARPLPPALAAGLTA